MIGLVILTHGYLGVELLRTAETMLGQCPRVVAIPFLPEQGQDELKENLSTAIKEVDRGKGIILLTDLCGGSCSTMAGLFLTHPNLEVITGVNLPMLIRLINYRDRGLKLDELVKLSIEGGIRGIKNLREVAFY